MKLVSLPEKIEGPDLCGFLKNWLPEVLDNAFTPTPVIERAHRIGQVNLNQSSEPRTIVMKFLNYRNCEKTPRAARRRCKRGAKEKELQVSFCPHLKRVSNNSMELAMNIPYGLLYPAHYS